MTDESNSEKKIYVDEDWKAKVEAEKEELKDEQATEAPTVDWPEPSLTLLVTTVATQAMMALGIVPQSGSDKPEVHLNQAKHLVDTIQLLFDKTVGNRNEEETALMTHMLHELRMTYVAVQQQKTD